MGSSYGTALGKYNAGSGVATISGTDRVYGSNSDGTLLVGKGGAHDEGFIYDTATSTMTSLDMAISVSTGEGTYPMNMSGNGITIAGQCERPGGRNYLFGRRETAPGVYYEQRIVGISPQMTVLQCDISDDGDTIFAVLKNDVTGDKTPFVAHWEEHHSIPGTMVFWPYGLKAYLANQGVTGLPADLMQTSSDACGMSDDGLVFAGSVTATSGAGAHGWIVALPEPTTLSFLLFGLPMLILRRR